MPARILFIYPNASGIRRIPLGISILSACLKRAGHVVELFDTTFYTKSDTDNDRRESLGIVLKVDMSSVHSMRHEGDPVQDLHEQISAFRPDIIAVSLLQDNYHFAHHLISGIKSVTNAYVVIGGVMPTLVPGFILRSMSADAVIVGEGETAMVQLADMVAMKGDVESTPNLAFLRDGEIIRNHLSSVVDLSSLPDHDYDLFHPEHLWRPFIGKRWKCGYIELTRGCPYSCSFCANSAFNSLYGTHGRMRSRDVARLIEEARRARDRFDLSLFAFSDENFLSMPQMNGFLECWKRDVGIGFMVQTRVETISREKVEALKNAGCLTISIGIESGDLEFRRSVLKRNYSNERAIEAFRICREIGVRTTANNIIGFPGETEVQIRKTIDLNRACEPDSVSVAIFAPYLGSELHEIARKDGLIDDEVPELDALMYASCLKFEREHHEMLRHYFDKFQTLVCGADKFSI